MHGAAKRFRGQPRIQRRGGDVTEIFHGSKRLSIVRPGTERYDNEARVEAEAGRGEVELRSDLSGRSEVLTG